MSCKKHIKSEAGRDYRGADIDRADDCKVTDRLVREDVKELNNNPRNHDK